MPTLDSIRSQPELLAAMQQGLQPKFLFFWGHTPAVPGMVGKECLSQWWPAAFTLAGVTYPTAEHYMMAEKARLFGDAPMLNQILKAKGPAAAKRLGRGVQGFDEATWTNARFGIVVAANLAKFGQNPALQAFLLGTRARILVEASPRDKVWGIGLAQTDPRASDPAQWRGLNLLGFALMAARAQLQAADNGSG